MADVPLIYKATGFALDILDRLFKTNVLCEGEENLIDKPTLFVVNHFTRMETFILPHLIYKHTGKQVHSLADAGLFAGKFGQYLESLGAISTKDQFRNRRIIGELMTGAHNWVIFPEGMMVKSKKVFDKGRFYLRVPDRQGPPHTGAAVLALTAEINKRRYFEAMRKRDTETMRFFEERYKFTQPSDLSYRDLVIVPVNITYYPIRPGPNVLSQFANSMIKNMPDRLEEELEMEGQLLFSDSDITVYFDEPIPVHQYVDKLWKFTKYVPVLNPQKRMDFILSMQKRKLTRQCMQAIYSKVAINYEHLFCSALRLCQSEKINKEDIRRSIYLTASNIWNLNGRRTHASLGESLIKIISDEPYEPHDLIETLAVKENILQDHADHYHIDREAFSIPLPFHNIRRMSLVRVISNELEPLRFVHRMLKTFINSSHQELRQKTVELLQNSNLKRYEDDYRKYFEEGVSKPIEKGQPFFLKAPKSKVGVLLIHGFLASPMEVKDLGESLHEQGWNVYGVNLRGHGTTPKHLSTVQWQDWVTSVHRGYALLKNHCDHVILGGFSAGGLLALRSASVKSSQIAGTFCINAALKLNDIKTHLIPGVLMWNQVLDMIKVDSGKLEYTDNQPENPDINYHQIPLKAVSQLDQLSDYCRKGLTEVTCPTLILQAKNDPVVNPKSAEIIHEKIQAKNKELIELDFDRHVIVRGDRSNEVHQFVIDFIKGLENQLEQQSSTHS